jgi:hypothetical protein
VPSLSGDALGTSDTDFFNCVNEEENDPTANVLGWQLAFTDLLGRAQELVFWWNDGQWTNPLVPWRITREPPLMRRDGATLVRLRTGHSKYAFDRGFVIPTSWYDTGGNHPLDLCAGTPCQGAPLTSTLFSSLPADPDDHCTAVDGSGNCTAYADPQMLIYRYNYLDAGFMPGSTLSLTPICQPAGSSCPEPPPAQCDQIDAVNIFGLPWGDVVLYPTASGSRQPPFGATVGGWVYLLTRTADGPLGQANFQLTITASGASSPTYSCTFTTGNNFDCFYAGPIALNLPGIEPPWLEFYMARDCDAVDWQLTFHGSSADGHDWSAGSPITVPVYLPVGDPNTTSPGWFHLPSATGSASAEAPAPGDTARRVDLVRIYSRLSLRESSVLVSDLIQRWVLCAQSKAVGRQAFATRNGSQRAPNTEGAGPFGDFGRAIARINLFADEADRTIAHAHTRATWMVAGDAEDAVGYLGQRSGATRGVRGQDRIEPAEQRHPVGPSPPA